MTRLMLAPVVLGIMALTINVPAIMSLSVERSKAMATRLQTKEQEKQAQIEEAGKDEVAQAQRDWVCYIVNCDDLYYYAYNMY